MTVRSEPLVNGERAARRVPNLNAKARLFGAIVLFFGLVLWVPAARWTIDGWVAWLNGMAEWLGLGAPLPRLSGSPLLVGAGVVGGLYTFVELWWQPIRRVADRLHFDGFQVLVIWIAVTATDVYTTYLGFLLPPGGAPDLWREAAQYPSVAALVAILLTFIPNWLILGGLRRLGGR